MKNIIIAILVLLLLGGGVYWYMTVNTAGTDNQQAAAVVGSGEPEEEAEVPFATDEKIGTSAGGHDIIAYHFGNGTDELLFVGGLHGGYEWNTTLVAYELIDYIAANPAKVAENVRVTIIPAVNPDGLMKTVGTLERFDGVDVNATDAEEIAGRFNSNGVDLNRNFDCDWQANGTWQNKTVSGGSAAFSEPESAAIRDYVAAHPIKAAVVWYASADGVFASSCHNGVSAETTVLMNTYANASGYPANESFDFYAITGDMVNWFAKEGIPAVSVLLKDHESTEWTKNQKGIDAVLEYYGNASL